MNNIINDLSVLTTILERLLERLSNKIEDCIVHNICESETDNCKIDFNFGLLIIKAHNGKLIYEFIPNNNFNKKCELAMFNKKDTLIDTIESRLVYKIMNTYKDLI